MKIIVWDVAGCLYGFVTREQCWIITNLIKQTYGKCYHYALLNGDKQLEEFFMHDYFAYIIASYEDRSKGNRVKHLVDILSMNNIALERVLYVTSDTRWCDKKYPINVVHVSDVLQDMSYLEKWLKGVEN